MAQYLLFQDESLKLADPVTGKIVTIDERRVSSELAPFTQIEDEHAFFATHNGFFFALDRTDGGLDLIVPPAVAGNREHWSWNFEPDGITSYGSGYLLASYQALFRIEQNWTVTPLAGTYPQVRGGVPLTGAGDLVSFDGNVFFVGSTVGSLDELFISDGTVEGTRLFRDFYPQNIYSNLHGQVNLDEDWILGDRMVFTANYEIPGARPNLAHHTRGVWSTDGTEAGTFRLPVAEVHERLSDKILHDRDLWFASYDRDTPMQIWRTDGTVAGSALVADPDILIASSPYALTAPPAPNAGVGVGNGFRGSDISAPFMAGGRMFVALRGETASRDGTILIFRLGGSRPEFVMEVSASRMAGDRIFDNFGIFDDTFAVAGKLFVQSSAGALGGTVTALDPLTRSAVPILKLKDVEHISRIYDPEDFGDRAILLIADRSGTAGVRHKLISTDGTAAGTIEIAGYDNYIRDITRAGEYLYWLDGAENLMVTDGTAKGTRQLAADVSGTSSVDSRLHGPVELSPEAARALFSIASSVDLTGSSGPDRLKGGDQDDRLRGLDGNDTLIGGIGADRMEGGRGNDVYYIDNPGDRTIEIAGGGTDRVFSSISWSLSSHVETLTLTGSQAINGTGNSGANLLVGNSAANRLRGLDGNDTLDGGRGADRLEGGRGNDLYIVDHVRERLTDTGGRDRVASSVDWTLAAGFEDLTLTGAARVGRGNGAANHIKGNAEANRLEGRGGADRLEGGAGHDTLLGGAGNDRLFGGTGRDRLEGGAGRDLLYGGADTARDVFVFRNASDSRPGAARRDQIDDFRRGRDDLDLSAMDADSGRRGNQDFDFSGTRADEHSVWYIKQKGGVLVRADHDGDARADFEIWIHDISRLSAGDFLF